MAEQKGEAPARTAAECMVDVRVGAHIPEDYIDNLAQRIDIYKGTYKGKYCTPCESFWTCLLYTSHRLPL